MKYRQKTPLVEAVQAADPKDFPVWLADAVDLDLTYLTIRTIDGLVTADFGDWIIRTGQGQFQIMKPDKFSATYESVTD